VPRDHWSGADQYEAYVGRWSRAVAPRFIEDLGIPAGRRWLDVGSGTGAVARAILDEGAPASVVGVDPSQVFLDEATATIVDPRARFIVGDGASLPFDEGSFDVVVSGLVLNHIPNHAAVLAEMHRVAARGGTVAAYIWDYRGRMDLIRRFWDAAVALDPAAAALDQGANCTICSPGALAAVFESVELTKVDVHPIDVPTRFRDLDDYWAPFLGGVGPAPAYVASLAVDRRQAIRQRLAETLPIAPDGSIDLIARAWAVRGQRP
jgi:SAM-dependent methyltransferase